MILELKNTSRRFTSGERSIEVLSSVNFGIAPGETVAIVGPSGSGKTTLLGLCAGLDTPTSGTVQLVGGNLGEMSEDQRAILRRDKVGFVFQNFELIPTLTALENVAIPLDLRNVSDATQKAQEFLNRVGLEHRAHHYPTQLSGGEQQRVAIARAFVHNPEIVFADEPTGNLDEETGSNVEKLLFNLNKERGTTLVLVTHNLDLAAKAHRVIELKSGKIIRDEKRNPASLEN